MLVDRAEVALQAVLRLRHMLAVGDRRAGDEHRDRQHDDGRKQPVHRPVGALGIGPPQGRDDVQQELFHCSLKRPDLRFRSYGEGGPNSISAAMRESSGWRLSYRAARR